MRSTVEDNATAQWKISLQNDLQSYMSVLNLLTVLLIVSSCISCSSDSYFGFVPISRAEAELFAKQFVTDINNGNKEKLLTSSTDLDAHCANYFFRGLDIPPMNRNATRETQSQYIESVTNSNSALFRKTGKADFLSCKENAKMCAILVRLDTITFGDIDFADKICRCVLLKNKKTGDIFIVTRGFVENSD